ncbi:MAG: tail fiber domain-containing protein [Candidatus Poseidoniales archaeon]
MPGLNVKPQSIDVGSCKPPQRIDVGLRDHHQTWLANYNEIRTEVNKAVCSALPRTLVYRNHEGSIGANAVFTNELVLGSTNPNTPGVTPPIVMSATEFKTSPGVTTTIQGPAFFSNTTTFQAGSTTYFEGPLSANDTANFNDRVNFYGFTHFHPSSILKVEGISYFDEEMFINDNVDMTGDLTLVGDIAQTGNTVIDGNLDVGDDLIVRGNLSVLGDSSTFNVSDLRVEDKNIIVNHGAPSAATDAGIWFQHFVDTKAGYMTVDDWSTDYLTFKAPTAFEMKIDIPIKDVNFRLEADFAADQELLTTSDVAHRSLLLDKSYSRHFDVPSYTQQHDPIAKDRGWLSTPWVYTNAVESNDNLKDANTTGLYMGTTSFTVRDEIALYSHGEHKFFLDSFGKIGFGTKYPTADLHLQKEDPSLRISTLDYTSKATLSFTDFSERLNTGSMYLEYDSATGNGLLELSTLSPFTQFAISVGGYQKQPEIVITDSTITIHDDVEIYGSEYVSDELIVDNTLFVRSHLVGVNRVTPDEALDVSGNIKGDSDLILNGLEPFVLIGPSITSLENMGRSGVAIEEQSPLVQMTVTEPNYRHGSILYFNDSTHDKHWVMGTVNNGSAIDLGKAHGSTKNTPEYGLDEYHGETLMRMDETDRVQWYLESTDSNPAMRLNTRNNGVHLYLGEQNDLFALTTDTTSYTADYFSSSVQWHGDSATDTVGEISYFPNGNDDWEFGSFRFSRTNGTVNTGHPSAKVGVEQLYAHDKIGVSNTAPTAELHITKDVSQIRQETEDNEKYFQVDVDTTNIVLTGNNSTQSTYFTLKALNPADFTLVSQGTHKIQLFTDRVTDHLYTNFEGSLANTWHEVHGEKVRLAYDNTKSTLLLQTDDNQSELNMVRPDIDYTFNIIDNKTSLRELKTSTLKHTYDFNDNSLYVEDYLLGYTLHSYNKIDYSVKTFERYDKGLLTQVRKFIDDTNSTIDVERKVTQGTKVTEQNHVVHPDLSEYQLYMNNDVQTLFMDTTKNEIAQSRNTNNESNVYLIDANESSYKYTRGAEYLLQRLDSSGNFTQDWNNTNAYLKTEMTAAGVITESFSTHDGTSGTYHFNHHTHPLYTATHDHLDFHCTAIFENDVTFEQPITVNNGFTFPSGNGGDNMVLFELDTSEAASNHTAINNNYIKWTAESDLGVIRFASNGDGATFTWGDTSETVDSSRMIFETGDNGTEGFEFKNGARELFLIADERLYANRTFRQTHQNTLMEYQGENKWLLKDENADDGIFWNKAGGAYSFSNGTHLAEYTNTEDEKRQLVFVSGGAAKAAIDLDTGSIRTTGDVVSDADIISFVTSDINFKENVKLIENPFEKLDQLRGVHFDWKPNPSGYVGDDVGVIAQEVEKVLPSAVRKSASGQLQVNYEKIIPLLIECIKELKAKIGE